MATVDLNLVGDNNALCAGASVTLQCTLTGDLLIWNTPQGALNFVEEDRASLMLAPTRPCSQN